MSAIHSKGSLQAVNEGSALQRGVFLGKKMKERDWQFHEQNKKRTAVTVFVPLQ